jgi:two-component system nitrogen regulation response regulator GlnG
MPILVVVDDEPTVLYSIEKTLRSETLTVLTALTARQGLELIRQHRPDAVLLDVRLADQSGLEVFDLIRQIDPQVPVIIITAYGSTETAIEAMKRGAFEYLLKPFADLHQLREVVQRALELSRLRRVPAMLEGEASDETADRIVGQSPAMQEVYKAIGRASTRDVTVLITGESGTGKELVARALYQHSTRSAKPFLALNCAAIPETLLESELFGHEKGAFTGADRLHLGKFEQAHQGVLFLDEIGDMSAATQAKVLRLLQEQRFERVGGHQTIQTDVRLIAATNRDLAAEVAAGRFRGDLYYRLNVFSIPLPPLRERHEDIPLLVEHFLRRFGRELGRTIRGVPPETMQRLVGFDWPGNVRQLQSVLKYALIQAPGDVLTPGCLPEELRPVAPESLTSMPSPEHLDLGQLTGSLLKSGETDIYRRICNEMDRVVLDMVLRHVKGNQVHASELLGISRTTLRAKLRALGLSVEKSLQEEANPSESSL